MATSTYDLNLQLALATTAASEGDLDTALEFLAEAHRLALEGAGSLAEMTKGPPMRALSFR